MNFDDITLNHLHKSLGTETFEKAMRNAGLVYVQRQISVNGKPVTRGYWIRPEEAKSNQRKNPKKMSDTRSIHTDSEGKYTKSRARLHDKIINDIVRQCEKPAKGQKPIAILMGGGSASGKSTMRKKVINGQMQDMGVKAGTVDSDEIKDALPEFASLKKTHPEDAARLVHEESSDVGAKLIDTLIDEGRHFVYDGTMKSKSKYLELVDRLKKAGYEVHCYVADVPLDVAKERSDARAKRSGRKVPHEIIEASHRGVPKTIEAIKDKVDSFKVFDNTDKLKLIASNEYVDPEKYSKFLEKGGVPFRATPEK